LYFAAFGACQNKNSKKANNIILWVLHTGPCGGLINPLFEAIHVPTTYNANLAAQQGLFIYCRDISFEKYGTTPTYDLVKVISDLKEIDTGSPYLEAIRIPVTEACTILGILDSQGCSPSKYFPGLEGVFQTLEMRRNI